MTPLHLAGLKNHPLIFDILIKKGANKYAKDLNKISINIIPKKLRKLN